MACDPLTFSGVDSAKWEIVKETINRDYGIPIDSETGQESKRGFSLRWAYDPDAATLEIQCLDKPFITPCGVINGYINSTAEKAGLR